MKIGLLLVTGAVCLLVNAGDVANVKSNIGHGLPSE